MSERARGGDTSWAARGALAPEVAEGAPPPHPIDAAVVLVVDAIEVYDE